MQSAMFSALADPTGPAIVTSIVSSSSPSTPSLFILAIMERPPSSVAA
jgi:hypothetical protein